MWCVTCSMFVNTVKRLRVLKSSELSALCREFFDPHSLIPHVSLSTTLRSVLKFLCLLFSVGSSKQEKAPLDSALKWRRGFFYEVWRGFCLVYFLWLRGKKKGDLYVTIPSSSISSESFSFSIPLGSCRKKRKARQMVGMCSNESYYIRSFCW